MGLLDHLCGPDVNRDVLEYSLVSGAVLLDVRTQQEFNDGHIPGSVNLPLQMLDNADEIIENVDVPLYVYCRSGARSRQAVMVLKSMGYRNVTNIGGISAYTGKVER